jgi:polyisoprenoid-binding protein YceI
MTIEAPRLAELLSDGGVTLVDVRLPEDFAAGHIRGAINQCVFEVACLKELEEKGISKHNPIVVYGWSEDSHESRVAAEKLERAGYANVLEFRGGVDAWTAGGRSLEKQAAPPSAPKLDDGVHALELSESHVVWIGRNLINKHSGKVAISSGKVEFRDGMPVSGEVTLDMRRMTCSDLAGNPLHDVLIHHLQSDDFFDVERFPEARFSFDRAEQLSENDGSRNLKLHGQLTMRGIAKPLTVEAAAGITAEGKGALQATLAINRTEWGVLYGSGSFFKRLAGHLVNDEVEIQLRILTV